MPELYAPDEALVRVAFMLPYIPAIVIACRLLIPRLSTSGKFVAIGILLAQTAILAMSLVIRPSTDFERWFWDMNREWNIPAMLAATQLLLVAGVALYAAWFNPRRPSQQRFYLMGVGLLFAFFALDEAIAIHEAYRILEVVYALLGPIMVAVTALVAMRSPRKFRIWHICFATGLVIAGIAEIGLEQLRHIHICGSVGPVLLSECLEPFYLEEPLGFLGVWLTLVAVLGHLSEVQRRTRFRFLPAVLAMLTLWAVFLSLTSPVRNTNLPAWATPASVVFESGMEMVGYRLDGLGGEPSIIVHFPFGALPSDTGYSFHLIDMVSQKSIVSINKHLNRKAKVTKQRHDYRPLYQQVPKITLPLDAPANRAMWIVVSLWRERNGEFARRKVLSSDLELLDDAQVILGELVLQAESKPTILASLASFDEGFELEAVEVPDAAKAGETLPVKFTWRADEAGDKDYAQFFHLRNEQSGEWWGYDQFPLGPRLPTRLWYSGLADSETWQITLPADLAPGTYNIFTGLYRVSDLERLPVTDAEGTPWPDNRVALGSLVVE